MIGYKDIDYDKCIELFQRFMRIIDHSCNDFKDKRAPLLGFVNSEIMNDAVVCATSKQFTKKTLKGFFCRHVLELSERDDLSIKQYEKLVLNRSTRALNWDKLSLMTDEKAAIEHYLEITEFIGESATEKVWTPVVLMNELRRTVYRMYLIFYEQKSVNETEQIEKRKKYIDFVSAVTLFHIFEDHLSGANCEFYYPISHDETESNLDNGLQEEASVCTRNAFDICENVLAVIYRIPLLAALTMISCTEFLTLREASFNMSMTKTKYDRKMMVALINDDFFRELNLFINAIEKNNTERYKKFDEQIGKSRLIVNLLNGKVFVGDIREDLVNYISMIREKITGDNLLMIYLEEIIAALYVFPENIINEKFSLYCDEQISDHQSSNPKEPLEHETS